MPADRVLQAWPRLALAFVTLCLLGLAAPALLRGARLVLFGLRFIAPLDGQEGTTLWEASLLREGIGLYLPLVPGNFVSAPYPPVHPLVMALAGGIDGPSVFTAGRGVSVLAALGVAICGFGLVRQVTRSSLAGLATSLLLLAFAPLQIWAVRVKPDMLGLLWVAAGLWSTAYGAGQISAEPPGAAAGRSRRHGLPPALILAACFFVLAHFTKQTMLAGPLAAGTLLLLIDRRRAIRWGLLYLALLGLVWVALDIVTHGQYTFHVWTLHKFPWSGARFARFTAQLRDTWPLVILGFTGLVISWRRPTIVNAYLLWAPASLIGAGVTGSNHNHLLETGLALALAGGQAAGLGLEYRGLARLLAPALAAAQLWLWQTPLPWFERDFRPDASRTRFVDFIRATPGEIMADDVGLVYAAGRPLRYDDPAAMGPAAELGLWDERQFVADIRAGRFSAILLHLDVFDDNSDRFGRWTPEMLEAVREAYTIKFKDELIVYVPKEGETAP